MTKQEFKKGYSEYRKSIKIAVRLGFDDFKSAQESSNRIFIKCGNSSRPVSIAIWLYKRGK